MSILGILKAVCVIGAHANAYLAAKSLNDGDKGKALYNTISALVFIALIIR